MLDTYQLNLAALLLACGVLVATRPSTKARTPTANTTTTTTSKAKAESSNNAASKAKAESPSSQNSFFLVYALVMASDWLQGPFLYSLYRDEHALPPHLIPALFTTGFLAGALSAPFIGALADAHGRRAACLVFCLASASSSLLTAYPGAAPAADGSTPPRVALLFVGRALGGLATSLLFSVFETWMVADVAKQRHAQRGGEKGQSVAGDGDLSATFGLMSTVNSVVAIVSGLASEWLVGLVGTSRAPFGASALLVGVAAVCMLVAWDENYGATGTTTTPPSKSNAKKGEATTAVSLWNTLTTPGMLALTVASTAFEGSMYLFVVLWAPVLESAAAAASSSSSSPAPLPYGLIFASFMSATLLSSLAYPRLTAHLSPPTLLALLLATASLLLHALASRPAGPQPAFWLFCAFEAVVGAYFPAQATLKNALVPDAVRGRAYAALRVPLNVFVVLSLQLMGEGSADAAGRVFAVCALLLQVAAAGVWVVGRRTDAS
ncbi:Molybdate-anion transporter like protein [Verticillium longisporum]|uniref:Molybdate-anion transporter like protein n=1 Tax=Verticillium longisporum TaxID=100787 RepID=A0A8I2ZGY1_VERLO|nr:Molybdate-anion transporter like protein [Verticillium longisporum]KAG7131051.1 Molybdate-anion transporter like protein [Verticillium longisporum]